MSRLTSHLFRVELRRSRFLLFCYALFGLVQLLAGLAPQSEAALISRGFVTFAQCFFALFLVISSLLADPVLSASAGWKTRPVTRAELFNAKFLFVVGVVQAGFILSLLPAWIWLGFTFGQVLSAFLQWTLITSALVWPAAALISWASDFKTLGLRAGSAIGAMTLFLVLLEWLEITRGGGLYSVTREVSRLLVALAVAAGGGLMAWIMQARLAKLRASIGWFAGGFLAFVLTLWHWPLDLLKPDPHAWAAGDCEVVKENKLSDQLANDEQLLWSHFRMTGLPSNSIVAPLRLSGRFNAASGEAVDFSHRPYHGRRQAGAATFKHNAIDGEVQRRLREFYPEDTLWFTSRSARNHNELPVAKVKGRDYSWLRDGVNGRLQATLDVNLLQLRPHADLPLRAGARHADGGIAVGIRSLRRLEAGEEVILHESVPSLWLTKNADFLGFRYSQAFCLYVIHDPDSGEAWLLDDVSGRRYSVLPLNNNTSIEMRFTIARSALRARLAGVNERAPMNLRLHVYVPTIIGTRKLVFDEPDYLWAGSRLRGSARDRAGDGDLSALRWPGTEDPAAAQRYIREFLAAQPQSAYGEFAKQARTKLGEIGKEGLPYLIAEFPVRNNLRYRLVDPVLRDHADRSHIPALTNALARWPELAGIFVSKRWEADAAPTVLAMLSDHPAPLPANLLKIAAKYARPEHYADLRRHVILTPDSLEYALPVLRELPDFPFLETVDERWRRQRILDGTIRTLPAYATLLGHKDALAAFVLRLEDGVGKPSENRLLTVVREAVEFNGNNQKLKAWLSANLNRLEFDPILKRFRL